MIQVMIDLETMSTEPNAVIVSIGAVKFSVEDGIIDKFYQTVDAHDGKKLGLHISQDTVRWWKTQSAEARAAIAKDPMKLRPALEKFSRWYGTKTCPTWGNGSDFDLVILKSSMSAVDMFPPWKFWDSRCYRTMRAVFELDKPESKGVLHNALDDAVQQTEHLLTILRS
jgi:hypothetical protein